MSEEYNWKDLEIQKVFSEQGNIYFFDKNGRKIPLTSSGEDKDPVISPDKKQIIFIRRTEGSNTVNKDSKDEEDELIDFEKLVDLSKMEDELIGFEKSPNEIWTIYIDERQPKPLIKSAYGALGKNKILGWFRNLNFSPDSKKIYYVCRSAYPTLYAVHSANADGSADKWIHWGNSVDVIGGEPKDSYYGYLVIGRRTEYETFSAYVVTTPKGKEISFIGTSDKEFWKKHKKLK